MDLILCHTTADFDCLGAAVGLTRLKPGSKLVLTGGSHPTVRDFLALHRDEYALIERRAVNPKLIRSLSVVDTQQRDRLGKAGSWLDLPQLSIVEVYDHHRSVRGDIRGTYIQIESVGATTTLIVEQLQGAQISLTPAEATVMALGIHVDTGSLTFDSSTARDALALAWLMQQGARLSAIADYVSPSLSGQLQELLTVALENLQVETVSGHQVAWVLLLTDGFVPGLSSLATRLLELTDADALLLGCRYRTRSDFTVRGRPVKSGRPRTVGEERLSAIGRSSISGTDLNEIFGPLGGGGHAQAASVTWRGEDPQTIFVQLVDQLKSQIPQPLTARELMSSPVRTILPQTTIREASRILLRYGHSGLFVVDSSGQLVGIISRRDIDLALHHGFSHAPVKGYMSKNLKTITPDTGLRAIESLMVTYDIGRLPVLQAGQLVGIVTRTDVLRQLHADCTVRGRPDCTGRPRTVQIQAQPTENLPKHTCLLPELRIPCGSAAASRLTPQLWHILKMAANAAVSRGWHLYLVGGAVRDLLLADTDNLVMLQDIDLVVDGFHRSADAGAGVELAKELQQLYPGARLQVHGRFQTAALLWHKDPELDNLWVDIATARTEFYPYPAANPEVEASSISQDLYRRDFTINALALRLTAPRAGELLDFFGGLLDLDAKLIRVLHANSFIEDPTRIYRAVRFAVRLGFEIESQTEAYIHYAIESGVYDRSVAENSRAPALETRLKNELKYILQAPYWKPALQILGDLGALRCIHSTLELNDRLWKQMRLVDRLFTWGPPGNGSCPETPTLSFACPATTGVGAHGLRTARFLGPSADRKIGHDRFSKFELQISPWEMLLEVLITQILPEERGKVATNLQLPAQTIERLSHLDKVASVVLEKLPECLRPSQILQLLQPYDEATLILIAVGSPRSVRQKILRYLTEFAQVKSPLNGNDLKQFGYQRGPQFKQMLDALLVAKLDGLVSDRASAEAYLAEHFPRSAGAGSREQGREQGAGRGEKIIDL
ncbi:MAG: CBS domain-containing protein [Hormoscilla sp. SP12CHS1]|nr:CBS domain-containing protein [Hormoscilla sp. SP12CHS1]